MTRPDPWIFFDAIYCISVVEREDRRAQVLQQFAAVGLLERVEFVLVARHPQNREMGIFESHKMCLQKGLAAGAQHILIFEDDVYFRGFDPHALAECCAALDRLPVWNSLFLGAITSGSKRMAIRPLVRVRYRCLAHAYALNAAMAQRIVRQVWSGIPYDGLLRSQNDEGYAICPMCAFQGLSASDNQTVAIDRFRRLLGGLGFIQKMNELYQNHKLSFLAAHVAVGQGLVALGWAVWNK
jgi:GR25 family glycosyltransferase involved in LPS biosynthesis